MTAANLADALEGRREGREWRCRCPVHGGRSLSITEQEGRILLTCRAGCSQAEIVSELKRLGLWGIESCYETPPHAPTQPDDTSRKADRASEIWNRASPIESGDPVHSYLKNRGIILPEHPADLKRHPALDYWEQDDNGKPALLGKWPAMLAVVRNPQGRPVALHRTYITNDGSGKAPVQAPKKIYKVFDMTGSGVRLFSPKDGFLAIAEGIEDAMSAWILWQIPAWAVLGTSGMRSFEPPEDIRELMILADNDEPGKKAALELGGRLENEGKAVRIVTPSGQKDINQLLMKGSIK